MSNEFLDRLLKSAAHDLPSAGSKAAALAKLGVAAGGTSLAAGTVGAAQSYGVTTILGWSFAAAVMGGLVWQGSRLLSKEQNPSSPHAIAAASDSSRIDNESSHFEGAPLAPRSDSFATHSPGALPSRAPVVDRCNSISLQDVTPSVCSTAGEPVLMEIVNTCSESQVDVYWINFQCKEVFYKQLSPGETFRQSTYVTHPWRVRDHASHRLLTEIPVSGPTLVDAGNQTPIKSEFTIGKNDTPSPNANGTELCSEAGNRAEITVTNDRTTPIEFYWLDFDCKEQFKGRADPGEKWMQSTQDTHRFRVREASTHALIKELVIQPNPGSQRIYVSVP